MLSVTQNNHQHKPLMVQAPVRALDPDGVAVVSAGTLAFAIGAAVCWWNAAALQASGRLWYLGVAVTGTVIGLLGLAFGLFRKVRRRRRRLGGDDSATTGAPMETDSPELGDASPAPPRRAVHPPEAADGPPGPPAELDEVLTDGRPAARRSVEETLIDADGVPDRE